MPEIPQDLLPLEIVDTTQVKWPTGNSKLWGGISTWMRYRGKHTTCGVCQIVVHQMGMAEAPRARPASERRKGPNGEILVCSLHAVDWKAQDEKARADRDAKVAEQALARKAAAKSGL